MKRWLPIGVTVVLLLVLTLGLFATAWNPEDFTGDWYCAGSGEHYRFREGVVACDGRNLLTAPGKSMCGAYCFDRASVTVFAVGVEGLEAPRQLYLVHAVDGDRLCQTKDGAGTVYFYRSREAALAQEKPADKDTPSAP